MRRLLAVTATLAALIACQEPFGASRYDLVDDRVAALIVEPPGAAPGTFVRASAALSVAGRPWSDEPVDLRWSWVGSVAEVGALDAESPAHALGPSPALRVPPGAGPAYLALLATFPGGFTERAFIEVPREPVPALPPLTGLAPSARVVAADEVVELEAGFADPVDPAPRLRWMSTGGRGTFVERTRTAADWLAAEVRFDDGEEESREPTPEGPVTVLALAIGDGAGNAVRAEDLWLGEAPVGAWLADGRFLPAEAPVGPGAWDATLVADDEAPWGLALADVAPAAGAPPLDLDALLTGRALRAELVGQRVRVEVGP